MDTSHTGTSFGHARLEDVVEKLNAEEAEETFRRASKRLLNPPVWHKLAGFEMADLFLTDEAGTRQERLLSKGDLLKAADTDSPYPNKNDDARTMRVFSVEQRTDDKNNESILVAFEPFSANAGANDAPGQPTAAISIERTGLRIKAAYYDRTAGADPNNNTGEKLFVDFFSLIPHAQWKWLIHALLEPEIGDPVGRQHNI